MTIYLYVKTHTVTGLKYLGKTSKPDPHKYKGSGVRWNRHLAKHGPTYTTEILRECQSNEELKEWGLHYSKLWNIVDSSEWANLKEECGDGGDTSMCEKFKQSLILNAGHKKLYQWWNNGIRQLHCITPPDSTYIHGRLHFNNTGAVAGAKMQKGKIWVNNSEVECMVYIDEIPASYILGRLSTTAFASGRHSAKGTVWWNDGITECMVTVQPSLEFVRGRIKKQSSNKR